MMEKEISLNLLSTINCTRAVLPNMIQRNSGRVINIGSEAGRAGDPAHAVYSACKGGVIALTKAVARDVGRYDITVNCVCPHVVRPEDSSDVGEGSLFHGRKITAIPQDAQTQHPLLAGHALRRAGRPADIGATVVFLASEAAGYITGQPISVNGGDTMC